MTPPYTKNRNNYDDSDFTLHIKLLEKATKKGDSDLKDYLREYYREILSDVNEFVVNKKKKFSDKSSNYNLIMHLSTNYGDEFRKLSKNPKKDLTKLLSILKEEVSLLN